jgi:NADPH:quinone reductase-like Zn-dependent oxidoreductase
MAGMNPIDSFVVSGALPKVEHMPHVREQSQVV